MLQLTGAQRNAIADAAVALVRARQRFDRWVRRSDAYRATHPWSELSPGVAWERLEALVPVED